MPSPSETGPSDSRTASPDSGTVSPDSETVSWSHTAEESRLLRGLVAVSFGVIGGMALAGAVAAAVFAVGVILSGEYGVGLAVLAAVALAAMRVLPQYVAFRRDSSRSMPLYGIVRRLGWSRFAAASVFGLGVLWVGLRLGSLGFFVAVFGTIAVPMVVVSLLTSEGELDADAGTLTYCGTDVDLSALAGARRIDLGAAGVVVYRFSYVSGATSPHLPRLVVVPAGDSAGADAALREAVERGVAAESEDYDPPNPAIRATLAVFGVGFLAFGGVLLTVDPASPNPRAGAVLGYAALLSGVFGLLFLSLAVRSG